MLTNCAVTVAISLSVIYNKSLGKYLTTGSTPILHHCSRKETKRMQKIIDQSPMTLKSVATTAKEGLIREMMVDHLEVLTITDNMGSQMVDLVLRQCATQEARVISVIGMIGKHLKQEVQLIALGRARWCLLRFCRKMNISLQE